MPFDFNNQSRRLKFQMTIPTDFPDSPPELYLILIPGEHDGLNQYCPDVDEVGKVLHQAINPDNWNPHDPRILPVLHEIINSFKKNSPVLFNMVHFCLVFSNFFDIFLKIFDIFKRPTQLAIHIL